MYAAVAALWIAAASAAITTESPQTLPFASKRARCAMECYTKCVMAGTPKAVYCNCPISIEQQPCSAITADTLRESTVTTVPHVETAYKDVRTIGVKMEPYNGAFIYIFEYSTISGDGDNWLFAGASSSPQITFNIPDACRDYQFRAIVVLRSTDPALQLVVFRPRAIPVALPKFVVPPESIRLDAPRQSSDDQSLHVFVSWHNPSGYDDADIYGYEQPIAYPIRCQTPEDKLTQPRVELVEGGARMHLNLPIDVLQEKCRILVEVKMLPRCIRLAAHEIQASVELDCQKFPGLKFCRRDRTPQCADVVDVWGREGKAMVVWQPPEQIAPLHYVLRYGLADQVGARPFISRKIIRAQEIMLPGNATNTELDARPGIEYGLQVCGIYSLSKSKAPFDVVPVVPFICAECPGDALHCIDCAKVEDGPSHPFIPVVECPQNNCTNINRSFVRSNSASIGISPNEDGSTGGAIDVAAEIIDSATPLQQKHSKTLNTEMIIPLQRTLPPDTDADGRELTSIERIGANIDEGRDQFEDITSAKVYRNDLSAANSSEFTPERASSTTAAARRFFTTATTTTTEAPPTTSTTTTSRPYTTTRSFTTTTTTTTSTTTTTTTPKTTTVHFVNSASTRQTTETALPGKVDFVSFPSSTTAEPASETEQSHFRTEGIRFHESAHSNPKNKPCKQRSGVICEFGCVDDLRCECPKPDIPCIRGILCPRVGDLRVVYENKTRTLKLYSQRIAELLRNESPYDKLYLEFGELSARPRLPALGHSGSYVFAKTPGKEHSMLSIEKLDKRTDMFDKRPYEFTIEHDLNVAEKVYGLSVCALNSSLVPLILDNVLMEQSVFNDNSISALTQALLSPVELSPAEEGASSSSKGDTRRGFLIFLGPAFLVLGVMIFGLTILCLNLFRRRESATARLRRRGLLRDPSSQLQFTAYRPTLGLSPSFYGANKTDNTTRYYMTRNVHF